MFLATLVVSITYLFFNSFITKALPNISTSIIYVLGALSVIQLISIYFIFKWKKIGFYGVLGPAAISFVINVLYLGFSSAIRGLLGLMILYLLVRNKWNLFE